MMSDVVSIKAHVNIHLLLKIKWIKITFVYKTINLLQDMIDFLRFKLPLILSTTSI